MSYLQFDFETTDTAQAEILLALLGNAGFEGFEEEGDRLKAFIKQEDFDQVLFDEIIIKEPVKYVWSNVEQQNWNAAWESSFEPIRVGDFVAVRAAFHESVQQVKYEIIITPKMSFGTGHHATTCLMIEQMSAMNFTGKTVLDFGTGTGILAILAEMMGAKQVTAIDNDDWSIDNAKENSIANSCSRINIYKGDTIPENQTFDIILANINLNVILANLPAIINASRTDTDIFLSGFLREDEIILFTELARNGFACAGITQKGEWICLYIRKMQ